MRRTLLAGGRDYLSDGSDIFNNIMYVGALSVSHGSDLLQGIVKVRRWIALRSNFIAMRVPRHGRARHPPTTQYGLGFERNQLLYQRKDRIEREAVVAATCGTPEANNRRNRGRMRSDSTHTF